MRLYLSRWELEWLRAIFYSYAHKDFWQMNALTTPEAATALSTKVEKMLTGTDCQGFAVSEDRAGPVASPVSAKWQRVLIAFSKEACKLFEIYRSVGEESPRFAGQENGKPVYFGVTLEGAVEDAQGRARGIRKLHWKTVSQ
jgi:hypothetical protein